MESEIMSNYSCNCNNCCNQDNNFVEGINYCLFFGLNDQNIKAQIIPTAQAISFVQDVCVQYFKNGFTILEGSGDNKGDSTHVETSIYIIAINATDSSVFDAASIFQKKFNQSEILIEKKPINYLYFSN